jgi:O-antigen ligase
MIFGATLGWFLNSLNDFKKKMPNLFSTRILMGSLSFLLILSIIIGLSRGAFIFGFLLAILIVLLIPQNKIIKITGLITIFTIIIFTFFLKAGIIEKQINYQKDNNVLAFRDKVWNVSIEAVRFAPALGIGMSNWHFITLDHLKKSVESRGGKFNPDDYGFPGHSHNLYLTALVERGAIGLLITLIFMGAWIGHLIKTYRHAIKSNISSNLWVGSFSAWVTTFGIGTVNTTFHHEHAILACLFFGLYLSYTRIFLKEN